MYCKGPDPGVNLEVYGGLWANTDSASSQIRGLADNDGVNISRNSVYLIGKAVTVHVRDDEILYLGGHLWEEDEIFNPDYDLGDHWDTIPLYLIDSTERHRPL